jgi:hypothetical protein
MIVMALVTTAMTGPLLNLVRPDRFDGSDHADRTDRSVHAPPTVPRELGRAA